MARHAQVNQNNKFVTFLQYVKKEVSDKVDILYVNTNESLQIGTMTLMAMGNIPKVSKIANLQCLYLMEFIFCMQINIKVSEVAIIVFDRKGHPCPKYTKEDVEKFFAIY